MLNDSTRDWMINHQIRPWNVFAPAVLAALGAVHREDFVPPAYRALAFAETEIPLPHGQRMLKPIVEGKLLGLLEPADQHTALVIGTGSGFLAACLAQLVSSVTSLDRIAELNAMAAERLSAAAITNVQLETTDFRDFQPAAAVDRILITGSLPAFDPGLVDWLKPDGKLLVATGSLPVMRVERVTRRGEEFTREAMFETVLPPLHVPQTTSGFSF